MKQRYKADISAYGRAVDHYCSTVPQITHEGVLEFLLERVHEVEIDGHKYMMADNEYEDSELKSLCTPKYGY